MTTVDLYSKAHCVQCTFQKKKLDLLGIPYVEHRIDQDPEALAVVQAAGFLQAPVVIAPGAFSWSGYSPDKSTALATHLKEQT
ncbi:glutaredoxin domain-containing protein [Oerskovia enterophila]|uniref:glutaredoxin domain-containing protein n=1 Tax=Oerskovia enterophila TaxID=43678 RepID=UPI0038118C36